MLCGTGLSKVIFLFHEIIYVEQTERACVPISGKQHIFKRGYSFGRGREGIFSSVNDRERGSRLTDELLNKCSKMVGLLDLSPCKESPVTKDLDGGFFVVNPEEILSVAWFPIFQIQQLCFIAKSKYASNSRASEFPYGLQVC